MKQVHFADFENGVVKLQNDVETKLSPGEKEALKIVYFQQVIGMFRDLRRSIS